MPRSLEELHSLLEDGASVEISAYDYDFHQLCRLSASAIEGGGVLYILINDNVSRDQLRHIINQGENVVFRGIPTEHGSLSGEPYPAPDYPLDDDISISHHEDSSTDTVGHTILRNRRSTIQAIGDQIVK